MDPLEEMPVVVNCVLTREVDKYSPSKDKDYGIPTQKLYLYYAKRPLEKEYTPINDATVKVSGGGQSYYFEWNGECWTSSFLPVFEEIYDLLITLNNGKELSSSLVFPTRIWLSGKNSGIGFKAAITTNTVFFGSAYVLSEFGPAFRIDPDGRYHQEDTIGVSNLWVFAKDGNKNIERIITNHQNADNFNIIKGSLDGFNCYKQYYDYVDVENRANINYHSYLKNYLSSSPVHKDYVRITYDWNSDFCLAADFDSDRMVSYDDPYGIDPDGDGLYPGLYIDTRYEFYFMSDEYDALLRELANKQMHSDELVFQFFSPDIDYSNIVNGKGYFGAMYHYSIGDNPQLYIQQY